jgi:hypothetical protein
MTRYPRIDLAGKVFGKLTVLEFAGRPTRDPSRTSGDSLWRCRCECGKESVVRGYNLKSGKSTTCGCGIAAGLLRANVTHGKYYTVEHRVWTGIKTRCFNDKEKAWKYYGGRGITVCDRWLGENGFANFLADMGSRPSPRHSVEREDNDGNYEPDNCSWATKKKQMLNRQNTIRILHKGELLPLKTVCAQEGVNYYSARCRLRKGRDPLERLR